MGILTGTMAIVTGGASGIGLATAELFLAEGARVALLDIDREGLERAGHSLGSPTVEADVRHAQSVGPALDRMATELGGLTVLVNNAGIGRLAPMEEQGGQIWETVLAVNLTGTLNCIQSAAPLIKSSGGGAIINNASLAAARPTFGELAYSTAKAGVVALTKGAAQELAPDIRVNSVSPGLIRTPMSEPLFETGELLQPVTRATPLARAGRAEEVASVIAFLASAMASYITGQDITVDGGLSLPQAGIDEVLKKSLGR